MRKPVILITGVGGEIGHGLVTRLLAAGASIITFDVAPLDGSLAPLIAREFTGSITDPNLLERILAEFEVDRVFDLAALLSTCSEFTPVTAHYVNVEGTLNLLGLYKGMNILFDYSYSFEVGPPLTSDIYVVSLWKRPDPDAPNFLERYPQVTALDLGCDMPDKTASSQWMEHMAAPGQLGYLMPNLKLLYDSQYEIKRFEEDFRDTVHLSILRPRSIRSSRVPSPDTRTGR